MACVTKKYIDPRICSSCKRISGKHFLQLKTIDMMDRMLHEERVLVHDGKMQHMQRVLLQKLLVGDNIKYDIGTFYSDKGFLLNISLNEHRFNGTPKYLFRSILSTKRHTINLAFSTSKHDDFICQVLYGYIIWRSCFPSGADNQGET